jgi:hypothetical protein
VKKHPRLLPQVTLVVLVLLAGCSKGPPPRPVKFCEILSGYNQKLAESARAFQKTLLPLSGGQPVDAAPVRTAYQAMSTALQNVKNEVEDLQAPRRSPEGEELLDRYKTFLGAEESIMQQYDAVVKIVERHDKGPAAQWTDIQERFKQILEAERKALMPVNKAQQDFAGKKSLDLRYVR